MTTVESCLTHLKTHPAVVAICRCGSVRQAINDAVSDLDIWVFCSDEVPLSEEWVITELLPADARPEVLFEGRDDTLVEHLVLNVLTGEVVLNAKFLQTSVLTAFCARTPSVDPIYLEDLENYWTMDVLHDPADLIAVHKGWLGQFAVRTAADWLIPQLIARYSAAYWRSVYQGVLRTEAHAWRHLVLGMLEGLTWLTHLKNDRLPPARKWLFSSRLLQTVPGGEAIGDLLDRLHHIEVGDRAAVLGFYRALARLEDHVLDDPAWNCGFWWRAVFTERIGNLAALAEPRAELGALQVQLTKAAMPAPHA